MAGNSTVRLFTAWDGQSQHPQRPSLVQASVYHIEKLIFKGVDEGCGRQSLP